MDVLTKWSIASFLPMSLAVFPALAQSEEAANGETDEGQIVVTAPQVKSSKVWRQARQIARQTNIREEPLARFQQPICPGVMGMPGNLAIRMVGRIRYNADRVGARLAKNGDCRVNILVVFVRDGKAAIEGLHDSHYFRRVGMGYYQTRDLRAQSGPARAWNVTSLNSRDGKPATGDPARGEPLRITTSGASRIRLAVRRDIQMSTVVIDIQAVDGMRVDQIADYATMRALARTREPRNDTAYETILNLFDKNAKRPPGLTQFDIAYLKSIYGGAANLPAITKIAHVTGTMREQVEAEEADRKVER